MGETAEKENKVMAMLTALMEGQQNIEAKLDNTP